MNIVRRNLNFERGKDPKDSLGIGNLHLRKIQSDYDEIGDYVKTLKAPIETTDFKKIYRNIMGLKDVMKYLIINYFYDNFQIKVNEVEEDARNNYGINFGYFRIDSNEFRLIRNGVGNSFWFILWPDNQEIFEVTQCHTLKIFDQKFRNAIKKYKISI